MVSLVRARLDSEELCAMVRRFLAGIYFFLVIFLSNISGIIASFFLIAIVDFYGLAIHFRHNLLTIAKNWNNIFLIFIYFFRFFSS